MDFCKGVLCLMLYWYDIVQSCIRINEESSYRAELIMCNTTLPQILLGINLNYEDDSVLTAWKY